MIVGHTKFSPDSHFGTIKSLLKRRECQSILQTIGTDGIIRKSAVNNIEIAYKTPNEERPNWVWRDWKGFLKNKFRKCTGISNWHVIKILPEGLNIQVAEKFGNPLINYKIMDDHVPHFQDEEPICINPQGISPSRLEDLAYFKDFVDEEHKYYITSNY